MKAIVINELKRYYDIHKVAETIKTDEVVEPHHADISLLEKYISEDSSLVNRNQIIKKLSEANWKYMEVIFNLPMFHIFYFENENDLFGKGMNIFEIDMMSAVEKFESETGFKPHICTVKRN
jgi:hypothetical protein